MVINRIERLKGKENREVGDDERQVVSLPISLAVVIGVSAKRQALSKTIRNDHQRRIVRMLLVRNGKKEQAAPENSVLFQRMICRIFQQSGAQISVDILLRRPLGAVGHK